MLLTERRHTVTEHENNLQKYMHLYRVFVQDKERQLQFIFKTFSRIKLESDLAT